MGCEELGPRRWIQSCKEYIYSGSLVSLIAGILETSSQFIFLSVLNPRADPHLSPSPTTSR